MRLNDEQRAILVALQAGDRLKVHRTVDGEKRYLLHRLDESSAIDVDAAIVDSLERGGLIESNMKFPAATFLLTDRGVAVATHITGSAQTPMGPRNFA
ncbi:MAG: hypothetical protein BroJett021_51600 [Chloroflexota bacterium]|nr:hypothetical protein [Caldilinea sp.]GIK76172.1 MAG: hypothetical protein BroJett021_51600 [Chloroflexota bacterium]